MFDHVLKNIYSGLDTHIDLRRGCEEVERPKAVKKFTRKRRKKIQQKRISQRKNRK